MYIIENFIYIELMAVLLHKKVFISNINTKLIRCNASTDNGQGRLAERAPGLEVVGDEGAEGPCSQINGGVFK